MLTRRNFLVLSGAAALMPSAGLAALGVDVLGGDAFGTYWRLTVPEGALVSADRLAAIVDAVDLGFSPYRADSELSAVNRADTTDWLPASEAFRQVLNRGLQIARETAGAFDPTIGPLVSRYGFGPIRAEAWGRFEGLQADGEAVRKADARLSVDLCGIAKGHALDLMTAELQSQGIADFLCDLGGELAARGSHPSGRPWQVAVESREGDFPVVLPLENRAVATSGIVAQSFGSGEHAVSHIIDPSTGEPVSGETVTVSVSAEDATSADGWATALMAMPHERAIEVARAFGLDALLFIRDGQGIRPLATGRLAAQLPG